MRTAHQVWSGVFAATFVLVAAVQCSGPDDAATTADASAPFVPFAPTGVVAVIEGPANIRLVDGRAIHVPMMNGTVGNYGPDDAACFGAADQALAEQMLQGQTVYLASPPKVHDSASLVPAGYIEADIRSASANGDYVTAFEARDTAARRHCYPPPAPVESGSAPSSSGTDVDVHHDDTNHRDGALTGGYCRKKWWC